MALRGRRSSSRGRDGDSDFDRRCEPQLKTGAAWSPRLVGSTPAPLQERCFTLGHRRVDHLGLVPKLSRSLPPALPPHPLCRLAGQQESPQMRGHSVVGREGFEPSTLGLRVRLNEHRSETNPVHASGGRLKGSSGRAGGKFAGSRAWARSATPAGSSPASRLPSSRSPHCAPRPVRRS